MEFSFLVLAVFLYGIFTRVFTAKLGEANPISRVVLPVTVPSILQLAKGNFLEVAALASAFIVGWAHEEIARLFAKAFKKGSGP